MKIAITSLAIGAYYTDSCNKLIESLGGKLDIVILTDNKAGIVGEAIVKEIPTMDRRFIYHHKFECVKYCKELGYDACIFIDADAVVFDYTLDFNMDCDFNAIMAGCINSSAPDNIYPVNPYFRSMGWQETITDFVGNKSLRHLYEMLFYVRLNDKFDLVYEKYNTIKDALLNVRQFQGEGAAYAMALHLTDAQVESDISDKFSIDHKHIVTVTL